MTNGTRRGFESTIEAAVHRHDDLDAEIRAAVLTQYANQLRHDTDGDTAARH